LSWPGKRAQSGAPSRSARGSTGSLRGRH
jgi:hypothetical protein